MISVRGLTKKYGDVLALNNVNMYVNKGEIYGFIGHNGAGKSTAMGILAGLSNPDDGECVVNGMNVRDVKHPGDLRIGYLPEEPRFYPWMSAAEALEYYGGGIRKPRIEEILDWVGLSGIGDRRIGGYSRGMKQRLGIASVMVRDPDLLILDEPSSALDPEGRSDVLRLISEMKQLGKTILFSSHILSDVERICDTVGMIRNGEMILEKSLEDIQRSSIKPVFEIGFSVPIKLPLLEELKKMEGVDSVDIDESCLKVLVEGSDRSSIDIMSFLSAHNISVEYFQLKRRDLEDLFLREVMVI